MAKESFISNEMLEEAVVELRTVRDMLRWGFSQLRAANLYYGHGTTNAWDEIIYLILHALCLPLELNKAFLAAKLTHQERTKIIQLIERRINERIPTAYLTNEAWFAGLPFFVDQRVLIPRSPIAELIVKNFSPWIAEEKVTQILDLCTGSGCIAIACALAFPESQVDAVDISADALAVANINVAKHGVNEQVCLVQSDLFNELPPKQYDIIVSNPPYVDAVDMASLPAEYHHEPALGLAAGQDGLVIAKKILQQAHRYLAPEGILIVEVGNSEIALMEQYPHIPFMWFEFEHGGGGVFLLTAEQVQQYCGAV